MIYTITFNPALDYVVHVDDLTYGEVNRTVSEELFYGGKGINVSLVLHSLGFQTVALGFVAGFTGREIEQGLQQIGIDTDLIHLKQGISRINVKIKADLETDINGQGPDILPDDIETLFKGLDRISQQDMLVLAGSIPNTLPEDIYEKILKKMEIKKVPTVVDATGQLLVNVLKYNPFLVKPNNFELGEIFDCEITTSEDVIYYGKKLQQMGARNVLVSMAADGAILITETGQVHQMAVPKGEVKNSVGAGDSMVAGFIAGYLKTKDYKEALRMGTAAGSATAFSEGLANKDKVMELQEKL